MTTDDVRDRFLALHYAVWHWMLRAELARDNGKWMDRSEHPFQEPLEERRRTAIAKESQLLALESALDRVCTEVGIDATRIRSLAPVAGGFTKTHCVFEEAEPDAAFAEMKARDFLALVTDDGPKVH